ncbi:phosphoribulokinase/uridine kinase [Thermoclostridium stercorarium subsp. stercorarium DSM 8532]|uniref:Phosphoribulokinase/uridine kinase n=1 Tax=Thermoclostridium stercorarium (strain ATCC 35414 / DSM 8532 / NCIMB 11754) TaxID=1121335 RepID=L7VQY3_THES1|nr:nucleoside kinase [Thermoclostridium stercorarium]AGC69084.1 phosphoribulokinase/uridine kinase [Thermoclostridium stercorarium subsp. stercorarium DSM 8532]AGI40056.1 uridine kinase [Thermoclostridium stercorarium subsp. stercorarium DSM 8532]
MENKSITVTIDGKKYSVTKGSTLEQIKNDFYSDSKSIVVAAYVNNEIRELTYAVTEDCNITFIDLSTADGARIYERSLTFLLVKAFHDIFPGESLEICHSVSKGLFFECSVRGLDENGVKIIEARMRELVNMDLPFEKKTMPTEEAKQLFINKNRPDKYGAIKYREKPYVTFYKFDDMEDYFYGYMVPSSGYLSLFRLEYDNGGIVLISPRTTNPNTIEEHDIPKKLFQIFSEYRQWVNILGVDNVGKLNDIVESGKADEFIRISEALHEKKIARIADMIAERKDRVKVILIAGPSSSGKTTFAQRLSIQLRVNGLIPVTISTDDYFVDKDKTPLDENGKPDYEALEAVDLKLFNEHLNSLIKGAEVSIPTFNFLTGKREYRGRKLRLGKDHVLIIEGIHGLNPRLTEEVNEDSKFKIYISAITSMRIDKHNRIPTTDLRFIRRIVRDYKFRGCPAEKTIELWPSVRRGEERNIFPFQEQADVMFNSSLIYELGVLKTLAIPLLSEIRPDQPQYAESRRLIEFLSYFLNIESDEIPPNSILREFIGGSCFFK